MQKNILVVEDDSDLARLLQVHLTDLGFDVDILFDGLSAWNSLQEKSYDLIILDIMMPGINGLDLCGKIRARSPYIPIIMLTARSSELDRVMGLDQGADDYLTKPFSIKELLARVNAIFRRIEALPASQKSNNNKIIQADSLTIDPKKRMVTDNGENLNLTAKEFDLLYHFASNPGRVYTRAELLEQVWGYSHSGYDHTVNSHINRLRAKIEQNPAKPHYILTVWGVGYKFYEEG